MLKHSEIRQLVHFKILTPNPGRELSADGRILWASVEGNQFLDKLDARMNSDLIMSETRVFHMATGTKNGLKAAFKNEAVK